MTTRKAISMWLRDADQIPGNQLVAALAAEHDALLEALRDAVDNLHAEGFDNAKKDGGNPEMMAEFRAVILRAKGEL